MENKIMQTTDYDEFTFFHGNRSIDEKRLKVLMESIKTYGLINPIVVNQKKEIIDGQHRYQSCRTLSIPVRYNVYKVDSSQLLELIRNINSVQKNWNNDDIANAFAVHSPNSKYYKRYIQLRELGITHSSVIECTNYLGEDNGLAFSTRIRRSYHSFKNGNFEITDLAKEKLIMLVSSLESSNFDRGTWNKSAFMCTLLEVNKTVKGFSMKRFFDNYRNFPQKWIKAQTRDEHKRSIVRLYNYNNQKPIKVMLSE